MTSISIFMATFRVETIVSDFVGVQGASSHCITKPWCGSGITDVSRMHHGCIAQDACELQQSCELCIEAAAQSAPVCHDAGKGWAADGWTCAPSVGIFPKTSAFIVEDFVAGIKEARPSSLSGQWISSLCVQPLFSSLVRMLHSGLSHQEFGRG